jgi:predicted RNA-binding protein with TRAM domain
VGDELEVNITNISPNGDGITRMQGYVINIPRTKPRECIKIKIIFIGEKTAKGEIVK